MPQHPLFSVLIANYNNGEFLQEAINSVIAQTYDNWEIILVDDASTDNSFDIYKTLECDDRIHIHRNNSNKGCGYTKRRCCELSNGEICGFLDADDALDPTAIKVMVENHLKHPNCSLIYSQYYHCDKFLHIKGVSSSQQQLSSKDNFLIIGSGSISHFATFKSTSYQQTGGISCGMKKAIDVDLYLKLEEIGDTLFIRNPLYYYREETGSNISLGKTNAKHAAYWEYFARINACIRRNVSAENIIFPYIDGRYSEDIENAFRSGQASIRQSRAYKIGKLITKPFAWIRK